MKYFLGGLILSLLPGAILSQTGTEVYLFEFAHTATGYELSTPLNISDNEGYDNQPSFTKDGKAILFASTRNGQTDILWYELETGTKKWITDTPGGEYSPVLMPDEKYVSAVRLDPDGLQLLYKYSVKDGSSEPLFEDLVVGYYTWFSENTIFSFVLGDPQTLRVSNINEKRTTILAENPGRSIHRIPSSKSISFIDKSDADTWIIKSITPGNENLIEVIGETLPQVEDMVWLDGETILMGKENQLYVLNTQAKTKQWKLIADLSKHGISGITRLAFNNSKLALVASGK